MFVVLINTSVKCDQNHRNLQMFDLIKHPYYYTGKSKY